MVFIYSFSCFFSGMWLIGGWLVVMARDGHVVPVDPQTALTVKKKKQSSRNWILLDCTGQGTVLDVDKHAIMHRVQIHARDLRILDPLLSYPSTILGRERAIVLNLEVWILSEYLLLCPFQVSFSFINCSKSVFFCSCLHMGTAAHKGDHYCWWGNFIYLFSSLLLLSQIGLAFMLERDIFILMHRGTNFIWWLIKGGEDFLSSSLINCLCSSCLPAVY